MKRSKFRSSLLRKYRSEMFDILFNRKSNALTAAERQLRQERHKVHVMTLLAMGLVRNRYLNDKELQVTILFLPLSLLSLTHSFQYRLD